MFNSIVLYGVFQRYYLHALLAPLLNELIKHMPLCFHSLFGCKVRICWYQTLFHSLLDFRFMYLKPSYHTLNIVHGYQFSDSTLRERSRTMDLSSSKRTLYLSHEGKPTEIEGSLSWLNISQHNCGHALAQDTFQKVEKAYYDCRSTVKLLCCEQNQFAITN